MGEFSVDNEKTFYGIHISTGIVGNSIFDQAEKLYSYTISKADVFFYAYGIFHMPDIANKFLYDLNELMLNIPLTKEPSQFWSLSSAGRKLADLHVNHESFPPYKNVLISIPQEITDETFLVEKMRFPKKGQKNTIIYNSRITISNIPDKAYEYLVNGKSAIEWVMDRYQVSVQKENGIKNNPNDWSRESGNPRYILDLLLSIINISVQTTEIMKSLPKLKF